MSFYQTLQHATAAEREHLFNAPIIEACRRGDISRETYLAFRQRLTTTCATLCRS